MTNQRSEVLAANEAFYRAFEKKDIEAMSGVWSQGTASLCVHPGWNVLRGWKEIQTSWIKIFQNTAYIEINTDIITTEIGDNIAYIVLVENVLQVINGRRIEAQSMATNVFQLLGGKWYLVHHHASPMMR
ncbi:nuclear transport factor 2 family protein [Aetokthonos hydrillicola Thurmond2011]|jgi:ketosteroid isomerase-like protein|uniref:Nuclear transport factor 2 family protein n=1 Tax=Aetokthonos hydrillicola Thurmond2011 TaxID=2712845 RepID=A0AAP5I602_9CYAN|nr:nuclear transport factor 2 family protein [Aetokthonos hydrillicola]MBO3463316.1 nuclear transport factor 2 family protein [Aetokthonos hydrillicola CCALA 1050]MBW4584817.1 nuclear transport factor 2 family protein [Aetokthonos hydrillicola CCALA 1050]MDR9895364.1 nuclear transport factor 2 family protein [Aetokthonos hydrillicola Thurmond2011]